MTSRNTDDRVLVNVRFSVGRKAGVCVGIFGIALCLVGATYLGWALLTGDDFAFGVNHFLPVGLRRVLVAVLVIFAVLGCALFVITGLEVIGVAPVLRMVEHDGAPILEVRRRVVSRHPTGLPIKSGGTVTLMQRRVAPKGEIGAARLKREIRVTSGGQSIQREVASGIAESDLADLRIALHEHGVRLIARLNEQTPFRE